MWMWATVTLGARSQTAEGRWVALARARQWWAMPTVTSLTAAPALLPAAADPSCSPALLPAAARWQTLAAQVVALAAVAAVQAADSTLVAKAMVPHRAARAL